MFKKMMLVFGIVIGAAVAAEPLPTPVFDQGGAVTVSKQRGGTQVLLVMGAKRLSENFVTYFFRKREAAFEEHTLRFATVQYATTDASAIGALGGEDTVEVSLTEMFALLLEQRGSGGILQTGGVHNVFYIRDKEGVLRMVVVQTYGDGWEIDAHPLGALPLEKGSVVFFQDDSPTAGVQEH